VKVITIYNQSGGVMKTSLTMNLGYQLVRHKHSVLLIDMDPQASLTVFMGLEPADLEQTVADTILDNAPLAIHQALHGMDLLPANITLSAVEMRLVSAMAREWRLKRILEPIQAQYDFILIDAPPSLGVLSVLSLVASTHVLIPIQTQYKSYKGTELLLDIIKQVQEQVNPELQIAGIVPTIYASANAQDKAILAAIQEQLAAIAVLGLLEPLVVDRRGKLLAGGHRKAAVFVLKEANPAAYAKHFPNDLVPVRVVDFDAEENPDLALQVEVTENEKRRDYTSGEVRALAERLRDAGYADVKGRPAMGEKALRPALEVIIGKSIRTVRRYLNTTIEESVTDVRLSGKDDSHLLRHPFVAYRRS